MRRSLVWSSVILAAAIAAAPAAAQQRTIALPAAAGWKHAATDLILPVHVGGLARQSITDSTATEQDVSVNFGDGATIISVFLFHPAVMSVPMWFDRADTLVFVNGALGKPAPAADPLPFAPPHSTVTSGLRRSYLPSGAEFKGSALAAMPLGEWMVVLRITSSRLTPAEVEAKLDAAIADIGWPEGAAAGPVAVPVLPCPTPLAFDKRAKMQKPDPAESLLGALGPAIAADKVAKGETEPETAPVVWCRDGTGIQSYGVYRATGSDGNYLMALGDSGRVVSVGPGLGALLNKSAAISVTFEDLDGSISSYPAFNRLPDPAAVLKMLGSVSPVSRSSGDGTNITLSMPK